MTEKNHKYDASKILLDVSRAVSSSLDLDKVCQLVLAESKKALATDHASIFLYDENIGRLILTGASGFSEDEIDNIKLFGSWEVVSQDLAKRKKPLIVNDIHKDTIFKNKQLPFSREKLPIQSFMAAPLDSNGKLAGVIIVSNRKRPGHVFTQEDEELLLALSNHVAIAVMNAKLYKSLKNLFISTVTSLTRAIDAKDRYTSGHSERVMKYAVAIGREMGLEDELLENLRLASLLHDVGKIGIKESILMKPAKLLGYERRQVKQHPAIGGRIIESIDNSHKLLRGVLEHHERWDGKGYPNRLKGEEISLDGRIVAVADAFDALTSDRSYQKSHSRKTAFEEIKSGAATQFDPVVVNAFVSSYQKNPDIWQ